MIIIDQKAFDQKASELFKVLQPHRASDVMQRINLLVVNETGKRLPEYLNNGASLDEKAALVDKIIGIVRDQQWDKLPAVPQGQATGGPSKPVSIAPKPAILQPITPPPAPTPTPPPIVVTAPKPAEPAAAPDLAAQIAALIAQHTKPAAPAGPCFNEADVRRWVREELAHVFATTASVLKK